MHMQAIPKLTHARPTPRHPIHTQLQQARDDIGLLSTMPKADARASWPWPGLGAEGALADRLTQSSPLSLLILLAAVVVLAVWRLVRPHGTAKGPGGIPVRTTPVPGPPPRWPLGNTMELAENEHRFLDWLLDGSRAYGGKDGLGAWAFSVAFLPKDTVVHDPECVRHVLMNVDLYGKGPVWRANFWPILGDGIFSADGHSWMVQRKVRIQGGRRID